MDKVEKDKYYVIVSYPNDGCIIYSYNTLEEARKSYQADSDMKTRAIVKGRLLQETNKFWCCDMSQHEQYRNILQLRGNKMGEKYTAVYRSGDDALNRMYTKVFEVNDIQELVKKVNKLRKDYNIIQYVFKGEELILDLEKNYGEKKVGK